ncbi:MAG: hypothetical protein ACK5UY_05410 [Holosporales bacterium]
MMTAFQEMIDALFADPALARTITYTPVEGTARTLRAVIKSPDRIVDVREMAIHTPTLVVDVRVSDVPDPNQGDTLTIDTFLYVVQGEPVRDAENLVWTLDCTRP